MNEMINSKTDQKNIRLLKNLWRLRQTLDVYDLIAISTDAIKRGRGKNFFNFLRISSLHLIFLYICKIFEEEKPDGQGGVRYELASIGGVLGSIKEENAAISKPERINEFVKKYGGHPGKAGIEAIVKVVEGFREQHGEALKRFKELRDKLTAHADLEFSATHAPSPETMVQLLEFGWDFYMLVARAIICVCPVKPDSDTRVKASLKQMLRELGYEEIETEMA